MYDNQIQQVDELKQEINSFRPLPENVLTQLRDYCKISLTYSSNALEGNSLTLTETKVVLEDGITIGGKPMKDHLEAVGHAQAYDFLYNLAKSREISEDDILNLHRLFYRHIDEEKAGQYRQTNVIITGTEFIPPSCKQVAELMKQLATRIKDLRGSVHPVEFAALLHRELVTIHPFMDGNGRTARLLMNLALIQDGYVITIIPPILRNDYIFALQQAQTGAKDEKPFVNFISNMVLESEKDYIRIIKSLKEN